MFKNQFEMHAPSLDCTKEELRTDMRFSNSEEEKPAEIVSIQQQLYNEICLSGS